MTFDLEKFYRKRYEPLKLIGCRPGTLEQYEISLHHWRRFSLAILPKKKITSLMLAEFATCLAAGRQPATVNKILRHLKAILRQARREHVIQRMPTMPRLREPVRTPVAFLREEFASILQAAAELPGDYRGIPRCLWWRSFLLADWDTGIRAGALLQTQTCDVRLTGIPGLYIQPEFQKTWQGGWYSIHAETIEAIGRIYRVDQEHIWPWPFGPKVLAKHFRRICEAAGVICPKRTGCLLHRIRKSCCSYYEAAGGNGQRQMGHSHPSVTERYRDPRITKPHDAASKMPHGF